MDQINNFLKQGQNQAGGGEGQQQGNSSTAALGGFLNNALGGGQKGEANEDYLDKGIDFFQEKVLKEGPQDNETAIEQQKDNVIAQQIREKYKNFTGNDFPIKEKN